MEFKSITPRELLVLTKLDPTEIIFAHFRSMYRYDTNEVNWGEICFHVLFPLFSSLLISLTTDKLSTDVVGIVVSAGSIVAGLMLNLLVLIYTLAYNTKNSSKPITNISDFKKLTEELLASISYSIFLCIVLVISSFSALSVNQILSCGGKFLAIYTGTSTILCLLLVLKRCYNMIGFDLKI